MTAPRMSMAGRVVRLGISFAGGPPQRIRVREVVGEGRTITFLGRPSRTFDVAADGRFSGQLIAESAGDPDQMEITVGGGPVPSIGEAATPFSFGQASGAGAVPGTFSRTFCVFDYTAEPA